MARGAKGKSGANGMNGAKGSNGAVKLSTEEKWAAAVIVVLFLALMFFLVNFG